MSNERRRIPAFASACLGLFVAVALVSACLPEKVPAGQGRGHEETGLPAAVPGPFPAAEPAKSKPASRVVEPTAPSPAPLPGCRSIAERFAGIAKAAPDAKAADIPPDGVSGYVAAFNRLHGTAHQADQVAIVTSSLWGDLALVLFEQRGCEAGTEQITFSVPGHGDE